MDLIAYELEGKVRRLGRQARVMRGSVLYGKDCTDCGKLNFVPSFFVLK